MALLEDASKELINLRAQYSILTSRYAFQTSSGAVGSFSMSSQPNPL